MDMTTASCSTPPDETPTHLPIFATIKELERANNVDVENCKVAAIGREEKRRQQNCGHIRGLCLGWLELALKNFTLYAYSTRGL